MIVAGLAIFQAWISLAVGIGKYNELHNNPYYHPALYCGVMSTLDLVQVRVVPLAVIFL
jgi:hypothetical protein